MLHWKEKTFQIALQGAATVSVLVTALIFFFLFREAAPFVRNPGITELFGLRWVPVSFVKECYGMAPLISGSFLVASLATLLALPFGVGSAVYIAELARPWEREFLKPFIEILASVPSVVIGFFGLVVLAPLVQSAFGLPSGLTALTGALLLALMAVPTIISISEDAIRSVPLNYKEGSLALGASHMQTILGITLPAALSGITAAVALGMGRVIGETMAVLMVVGNAPILTLNPFDSVRTMTATIAAEMGETAFGSTHYQALFWVGIVLLVSTFALNMLAATAFRKWRILP